MSDSLSTSIGLGLIKSVVCVYDVVTLPIYALVQRPWAAAKPPAVKARPEAASDPYSPWIRTGTPPDHLCYQAKTISELFSLTCKKHPEKRSFGYREVFGEEDEKQTDGKVFKKLILGDYKWFTCAQIDQRVENLAKGFMVYGVRPGDVVLILAETRLEWMLSAQAIFRLGATIATLYTTLGEDGIIHGINETEVTHIVTTHDVVPKLKKFRKDRMIPRVKTIIYIEGHKTPDMTEVDGLSFVPLKVVEEAGREADAGGKFVPPKASDPAIIMYTSGSTGVPKGVIITHRNVLTTIGGFFAIAHPLADKEGATYIAYLPLAHVLELAAEVFFFSIGHAIGFSSPHTMTEKGTAIKKGQLGDAMLLKPTVMAAVPLVLDRIRKGVWDQMDSKGPFFKSFFQFITDYKKFWTKRGFRTPIINALVCKKIRAMLGGRIQHIVSGSAPLSPDTMEFIRACLDVTLLQGYGLTETAAGATIMDITDRSTGLVGPPLHGIKIKLVDWHEGNYFVTDKPHPRGEIVVGGGSVAAGYYKNDALTAESFRDEDGERWFYTGDIGEVYPDGSFKIVDRKKDLVKLQFGEYISLGKVETELKSCPVVDNICIHGSSFHNYLIAIVVPQPKALVNLAKLQGKEHMTHEQLCKDPAIVEAVRQAIAEHAAKAKLNKNETPCKLVLESKEWIPETGLVTAALKIRRKNITDHYRPDINRLYGISSDCNGLQSKST